MRPTTLNNVTETESRQNRPPALLSILSGGHLFGMYQNRNNGKIKRCKLN